MRLGPPHRVAAASFRLFLKKPFWFGVQSLVLLLSIGAVCCAGVGLVAAPWLGCELLASQIEAATGVRPHRTRAWFGAAVLLLGVVTLLTITGWLAVFGLGHELGSGGPGPAAIFSHRGPAGTLWAAVAIAFLLSVLYILPMLYATVLLVDRGERIGRACLASTYLVFDGGFLRNYGMSLASHLLQALPLAVLYLTVHRSNLLILAVALVGVMGLLAVTVPVGQGMFTVAYLERRGLLPHPLPPPIALPLPLRVGLVALVSIPVVTVLLLFTPLARPIPLVETVPTVDGQLLVDRAVSEAPARHAVPDTALDLVVRSGTLSVEASDGGGAGHLSSPPLSRIRVFRVHDAFRIEADTPTGKTLATWIDRAGVRLDDGFGARLAFRMPPWALPTLALLAFLIPWWMGSVVARLANQSYGKGTDQPGDLLRALRNRALVLLPVGLLCLTAGIMTLRHP
ncbi:MAG: hypothetical protein KC416_05005 [Myxococcales bacterium]|nr:hypothetical protein [Myxococcales bacterium]